MAYNLTPDVPQHAPTAKAADRRRTTMVGLVVLLAAGGIAYGLLGRGVDVATADPNDVARHLRENRGNLPEAERRTAMERLAALTEEERAALEPGARRLAGMAAWRERAEQTVDGYFATPPAERDAFLDRTIDEMMKMREEMERRRAEGEAERERRRAERAARGEAEPERGERGGPGGWGGGGGPRGNSANQARRAEFMAAIIKRAEERGIEIPRVPGMGGRGGMGGMGTR